MHDTHELYVREAVEFLKNTEAKVEPTSYGFAVIGENYERGDMPPDVFLATRRFRRVLRLPEDTVFHHRVLIMRTKTPIRSHEETEHEEVCNIGHIPVEYISPPDSETPAEKWRRWVIRPGCKLYSVDGKDGFYHGFDIIPGGVHQYGMVYVAKALRRDFILGDSFRMPENTYRGRQL